MLIQSHAGYVELLPALPEEWNTGRVRGLMARGGFQVDMEWQDGKVTELRILSKLGKSLRLRFGNSEATIMTYMDQVITLEDIYQVY
jgi:alpha-L-fucosidase 2